MARRLAAGVRWVTQHPTSHFGDGSWASRNASDMYYELATIRPMLTVRCRARVYAQAHDLAETDPALLLLADVDVAESGHRARRSADPCRRAGRACRPSVRASSTAASTSSTLWLDSKPSSRATFWTPILTSTVVPFVRWGVAPVRHCPMLPTLRARGLRWRQLRLRARVFLGRTASGRSALGEAADAAPGQLADDAGGLLARDRRRPARASSARTPGPSPSGPCPAGGRRRRDRSVSAAMTSASASPQVSGHPVDPLAHRGVVGEVGLEEQPEGGALRGRRTRSRPPTQARTRCLLSVVLASAVRTASSSSPRWWSSRAR